MLACSAACAHDAAAAHRATLGVAFCGAAAGTLPLWAEWEECRWLEHGARRRFKRGRAMPPGRLGSVAASAPAPKAPMAAHAYARRDSRVASRPESAQPTLVSPPFHRYLLGGAVGCTPRRDAASGAPPARRAARTRARKCARASGHLPVRSTTTILTCSYLNCVLCVVSVDMCFLQLLLMGAT